MRKCIAVCPDGHEFPALAEVGETKDYFGINISGKTRKLWKMCPTCGKKLHEKAPPDPKETVKD